MTVPGVIEELQGSITRQLKKNHETFDIDNTKLLKREKRIVERFESHVKLTQNSFQIEKQKRKAKFLAMHEEVYNTIRVDDRQSEEVQCTNMETIHAIKAELQAEREIREREDLEILGKLADAMAKLQHSILTNFGEAAESDPIPERDQPDTATNDVDDGHAQQEGEEKTLMSDQEAKLDV